MDFVALCKEMFQVRGRSHCQHCFSTPKEGTYNTVHQSTNKSCLVFGNGNLCFCKHVLVT